MLFWDGTVTLLALFLVTDSVYDAIQAVSAAGGVNVLPGALAACGCC